MAWMVFMWSILQTTSKNSSGISWLLADGYGGVYNPDRREAFSRLHLLGTLSEVIDDIEMQTGQKPVMVATDARPYPNSVTYRALKEMIFTDEKVILLLFGTGWGIQKELMNSCDHILDPIALDSDYNHLPYERRSIILDRCWANMV
jgi:hypothetical protein